MTWQPLLITVKYTGNCRRWQDFFARQAEKKSAILVVFAERGLYNNSVPGKWGQNVKVK
jgi:hypothetical protein